MKISVVSVCRNSSKTIRHTVESFLAQTHADKELLIIDGASSDDTVAIARSYGSSAIRILSEPDRGIYDAMNKGLALFSGDAVGFLNSDDTFHNTQSLSLLAAALENSDIAFGDQLMVTDHLSKSLVRTWIAGPYSRNAFKWGWVPPHPTFYVRRNVAKSVGTFNLDYKIASDYDFMLRAMQGQFRKSYVPHILVDFMMGGASTGGLRAMIKGNLECLDSRRRHLGAWPIDAALLLRPARRLLQINWRRGVASKR